MTVVVHSRWLSQAQSKSRAGLAELPGLRARVSSLQQQQLEQAQEEAAAAQQAAAAAEQQLQSTKQQLEQANKVREEGQGVLGTLLKGFHCPGLVSLSCTCSDLDSPFEYPTRAARRTTCHCT